MLIPELQARFPDRGFYSAAAPERAVVCPAKNPSVGPIEIVDEGDELTILLGKFTHFHVSNYDERLSKDGKADAIVKSTVAFLAELFSDQIVMWGTHRGGGGYFHAGVAGNPPEGELLFVWSGPFSAG
jgi:hypothetical protein